MSGFQLSFADHEVHTPGDSPYVLVAMNPAALKVNLRDVQPGGILVVNEDEFTEANLAKAGYAANPLTSGELSAYRVIPVAMTRLNEEAVRHLQLPRKDAARCKNFFALGMSLWLYDRPLQPVLEWLMKKFRKNRRSMAANGASLRAGYNYADTAELFSVQHTVAAARLPAGRYRRVTGNEAAALGLVAAAHRAGRTLVYASYPITPASEILHELSNYKDYDVRTLQVEDEIAACAAAIGASFAGAIGATGTSGPGLALKVEGLGLAVMAELPLVVIDVQRAGPSTGMPTKTEQADLLMAVHGRHGEGPLAVLAAATPADCFAMAFEAVRLAIEIHDAGDGAFGQFPGQRGRAVADRRARRAARPADAGDSAARRVRPLSPRPADARPAVGRARHARLRASHRRPGEDRRHRGGELRRREPSADGRPAGREDRADRPGHSARRR